MRYRPGRRQAVFGQLPPRVLRQRHPRSRYDPAEACDDGNTVSGDGCSADCVVEYCGDGITNDINEACDANDDPNCTYGQTSCQKCLGCQFQNGITHTCGDGYLDTSAGEVCDYGSNNGPVTPTYGAITLECDSCTSVTMVPGAYCGDGHCDSGNEDSTSCPDDCKACGNGIVDQASEDCDAGSQNTDTVCTPPTTWSFSGLNCTTCTTSCKVDIELGPHCGDGTCDAVNETSTSCPADCGTCGNGAIDGKELCDSTASPVFAVGYDTCEGLGFSGGTVTCDNCVVNIGGCTSPVCDNTTDHCGGACAPASPARRARMPPIAWPA